MDLAYDHIVEQSFTDRTPTPKPSTSSNTTSDPPPNETGRPTLQSELQETFRAFSLSPWASKLGGLWGNVRKQGETYYQEARREAETASEEARRGLAELRDNLVKSTRALSFGDEPRPRETQDETGTNEGEARGPDEETRAPTNTKSEDDTDSRIRENDTFIARFRSEAAKRLKDIERAEDAADEALLRFGTNIRNFLRDAIAVAPPETQKGSGSSILFESKEPTSGRRVIHASRLDAQLHVIHTRSLSFTQDPETSEEQWQNFKNDFHIESKTDEIAQDLDRYPDLRRQMEDLVPEKVQYETFWQRYYFLRHVLAVQEERRRELLKASSTNDTEEVGWDEDSDDDSPSTPQIMEPAASNVTPIHLSSSADASSNTAISSGQHLKVESGSRRSHDEKSVADSDASYDLVSGATSRAPGSPREEHATVVPGGRVPGNPSAATGEESDDDWE